MAASMMMTTAVSFASVLPARCAQSVRDLGFSKCTASTSGFFVRARTPSGLKLCSRRGGVRCEADDGRRAAKEQIINTTVEQMVQENERQSVPTNGAKPTNRSSPRPRPEVEHWSDNGSKGVGSILGDGLRDAKGRIDAASKRTITADQIRYNQAHNQSEKQSVFGAVPSDGSSPYPRPELERRPETGSKGLVSIFAFDGAAPETINGRLAMVGMVWAFLAEKASGLTVFEQLYAPYAGGIGLVFYLAVAQFITVASLIPFLNGESTDARSFGPFRARAERWNGRLAMLGFLALVITEQFTHSAVFSFWS